MKPTRPASRVNSTVTLDPNIRLSLSTRKLAEVILTAACGKVGWRWVDFNRKGLATSLQIQPVTLYAGIASLVKRGILVRSNAPESRALTAGPAALIIHDAKLDMYMGKEVKGVRALDDLCDGDFLPIHPLKRTTHLYLAAVRELN